jgi:hypothetical protein
MPSDIEMGDSDSSIQILKLLLTLKLLPISSLRRSEWYISVSTFAIPGFVPLSFGDLAGRAGI